MVASERVAGLGPVWTIGDVRVTSIVETEQHWEWAWLLPGATADVLAPLDWLRPDFVDADGRMVLRIQALVVEADGQVIVVDTCVGEDKSRRVALFDRLETGFLEEFEQAGFTRDGVDQVACTHLHVDHVGWNTMLVDGSWVPTFPGARYLVGRVEYEHWAQEKDELTVAVWNDSIAPIMSAGLYEMVESDHRLGPSVWLEPTPGHTPGHHSVRIQSGGQRAVITGDMIHHPVQFACPELASAADTDPSQGAITRRASFARWEADGALVIGTHFAGPGAGTLRVDGDGWRLTSRLTPRVDGAPTDTG